MKISEKGLELIKKFEGCKLNAYRCPAGKITIGYGHTKGVTEGMSITQAQADQFLRDDLSWLENAVIRNVKYSLNQNQFDALVSFTFNLGERNLQTSDLLAKINKGDFLGASKEFSRWVYA